MPESAAPVRVLKRLNLKDLREFVSQFQRKAATRDYLEIAFVYRLCVTEYFIFRGNEPRRDGESTLCSWLTEPVVWTEETEQVPLLG